MSATARPPDVVNGHNGEQLWFSGDAAETRIAGRIPAGAPGPPLHRHLRTEERFTFVSGRIRYHLDGRVVELGPGESVFVPRRAAHRFENPHAEEAEIDNKVRPGIVHEVLLRLLAGAASRPRPRILEMVVALHDGDSWPAAIPVPLARAAVGALRLVGELTGTARRFRAAHLPERLRT